MQELKKLFLFSLLFGIFMNAIGEAGNNYIKNHYYQTVVVKAGDIIKIVEGFSPRAYQDGNPAFPDRCSIGYGTLAKNCWSRMSEPVASKLMIEYVIDLDKTLQGHVVYKILSDNNKIRLLVFGYQRGTKRAWAMLNTINRLDDIHIEIRKMGYHKRVTTVEKELKKNQK